MSVNYPTLDEAQEKRIAAVHGGFLYQHLFAVACLLKAKASNVLSVVIERDEDVEIVLADTRIYVQVKTRSDPLIPSDLGTALDRFQLLREQHEQGLRHGTPLFVVASNQSPGPKLGTQIKHGELGDDVQFIHPGETLPAEFACLPSCWTDLSHAVADCVKLAETIPHGALVPESLVWKLAGKVQAAATGHQNLGGYTFHSESLPALFEQLLTQLQRLPALQTHYLPQIDEPALINGERIRIICGFSGAGKTSWCAQAAMHTPEPCIYFDARETAGPAFARSLVREIAGGLVDKPHEIGELFAPGASGIDAMTALGRHLEIQGIEPLVIVDNAHEIPAADLQAVFGCTTHMRFILLCQPVGSIQEVEQLTGVRREVLQGWSLDSVAAEASRLGARGNVETLERLRVLTAGMPLYLQSATRLAAKDYAGDLSALCTALEQQATLETTAQELILAKVYQGLPETSLHIVTLLSMVDVAITQNELQSLMAAYATTPTAGVNQAIRALRALGVLEVQGSLEIKLHDAMRLVGAGGLHAVADPRLLATKVVLKDLLLTSLKQTRSHHKLRLLIKTLIDLEDSEFLIELAGEELFQETGLSSLLIDYLEKASTSSDLDAETRFWAFDSLLFITNRTENPEQKSIYLSSMAQLVANHQLSDRALLSYHQKEMEWQGLQQNAKGVHDAIELIKKLPALSQDQRRTLDYCSAVALWRVHQYRAAEVLIEKVINEHLKLLHMNEQWIHGRPTNSVIEHLREVSADATLVTHLANAYEVKALLLKKRGVNPQLYRLYAWKFFVCTQSFSSVVRTGLDAAQDMMDMRDFQAARTMVGTNIIPLIKQAHLLGELSSARSFYAVILAYCRDFESADREMASIAPFRAGFTDAQRHEFDSQLSLIEDIRAGRVR
ncbi:MULTISPECIES: ATP-binding protein [unclassified Pseudomonas]|uniref:ATP-binding protein n=1 Tax=unclassified Pseudomonas TaxID=196821 RepID=UPI001CC032CD|nr:MULTISPECIES: ATP-binding protein [unclassified Pseudomonas]